MSQGVVITSMSAKPCPAALKASSRARLGNSRVCFCRLSRSSSMTRVGMPSSSRAIPASWVSVTIPRTFKGPSRLAVTATTPSRDRRIDCYHMHDEVTIANSPRCCWPGPSCSSGWAEGRNAGREAPRPMPLFRLRDQPHPGKRYTINMRNVSSSLSRQYLTADVSPCPPRCNAQRLTTCHPRDNHERLLPRPQGCENRGSQVRSLPPPLLSEELARLSTLDATLTRVVQW